jgi:hypothetical protein
VLDFQDKIYYERRAKQYAHNPTIKQVQRINLRILTQYFIGMFLNKPHTAHRHESFLLKEFSNRIFQESQSKLPYFVAAYTFYKLENLFRETRFHPELKAYKTHLAMVFRELVAGGCPNLAFEKPIDEHSGKILKVLTQEIIAKNYFDEAALIFKNVTSIWTKQLKKSQFGMKDQEEFTSLLLKEIKKRIAIPSIVSTNDENDIYKGAVMNIMLDKFGNRCGFIKRYPNNIFFHSKQNENLDFTDIKGKYVTYKVQTNPKNNMTLAINVEISK